MNINEAKQILKNAGYTFIKETETAKYTLIDKQSENGWDENTTPYEKVYGPVSLEQLKNFINKYTTSNFDEIPINPKPEEEPEEGFIIIGG
jgi:hypothetical protein